MSSVGKQLWLLDEVEQDTGHVYLLDGLTGSVYQSPNGDFWPKLIGKLVDDKVVWMKPSPSLYATLDHYLKDQRQRLKDMFEEFDDDGSGTLDGPEVTTLVKRLLPETSTPDIRYFCLLLNPNPWCKISYSEFLQNIKECVRLEHSFEELSGSLDVAAGLERVSKLVEKNQQLRHELFMGFGEDGLAPDALVRMLYEAIPELETNELQNMLIYLKQLDISGDSKTTFFDFLQTLRLVSVRRRAEAPRENASHYEPESASTAATPMAPFDEKRWILQRLEFEGKAYLVDRGRRRAYTQESDETWPHLVGKVGLDRITILEPPPDLFSTLHAHLNSEDKTLKEMFDDFDVDGHGALDRHQVADLVIAVLPSAPPGELAYFQVILDIAGEGRVTYHQFTATIEDYSFIGKALSEQQTMQVAAPLEPLSIALRSDPAGLQRIVEEFETDTACIPPTPSRGSGLLPRDVLQLVMEVFPPLTNSAARCLLLSLKALDLGGEGRVELEELAQVLRLVKLEISSPSPSGRAPAVARSRSVVEEWELEETVFEGELYLVDRRRNRAYTVGGPSDWPQLAGRFTSRGEVEPRTPQPDLFRALDAYLQDQQLRLRELFELFDVDGSGTLDGREVAKIVKTVLPDVRAGELRFLQVILDTDGHGHVSFGELVEVLKDCHGQEEALQLAGTELPKMLTGIRAVLLKSQAALHYAFRDLDEGSGYLSSREMAEVLKSAMPSLTLREIRLAMMSLRALDLDGDGQVGLHEIKVALRTVKVKRLNPDEAAREKSTTEEEVAQRRLEEEHMEQRRIEEEEALRREAVETSAREAKEERQRRRSDAAAKAKQQQQQQQK
ncbi:hypothetical protein CYMTET_16030 [Cymbomonas tetramitiformis]|uniref:EF-hand domain-containing protein n=1 Tax=Cymbomonas tetramitiformis TaxID=36881 RepID=A0AAE0L8K5_9CHLO|nr:hypothetical protein CYMTET_16030 [Cymbomonas tetramitiformis]|eukprot:gene4628-5669_t